MISTRSDIATPLERAKPSRRALCSTLAVLSLVASGLLAVAGAASAQSAAPSGSPGPATEGSAPPAVSARAAIVVDASTGEPLYARNADAHEPIASTTKLMTALLTLERAKETDIFKAPAYVPAPAESRINLQRGERMTVHDLMRALLLPSANDAAATLADGVAGSTPLFVRAMNDRARSLGLNETHYSNPVGLDAPDNYSSARDLARLAAYLLKKPAFAQIVDRPSARLVSGLHPRTVLNRNVLVGRYPFVTGVKTGHTQVAGYVLIGSAREQGAQVVSVALGDPSESTRDRDSLALLRYGLAQFQVVRPLASDSALGEAKIKYFAGERVSLLPASSVTLTARRGRSVTTQLHAPAEVTGPLRAGAPVGAVTVLYGGKPVRTVALLAASPVKGASLLRKLRSYGGLALAALACLLLAAAAAGALLRRRALRVARGKRISDDHHRHTQRGNRQDARRAELSARTPAPRRRADFDGRRQGRQRRPRP